MNIPFKSSSKTERNSTIEILKLFLMFGVVILHVCGGHGRAIELGGPYNYLGLFLLVL